MKKNKEKDEEYLLWKERKFGEWELTKEEKKRIREYEKKEWDKDNWL